MADFSSASILGTSTVKQITPANYKKDTLYPQIVRAVADILNTADIVTPVEVMIRMKRIEQKGYEDWRFGRIPYLEKVFVGSLGKANRILRILRMHAHDLNLAPSQTVYRKWGKGKNRIVLRFSRTGAPTVEEAYSRHFVVLGKRRKNRPEPRSPAEPHLSNQERPNL